MIHFIPGPNAGAAECAAKAAGILTAEGFDVTWEQTPVGAVKLAVAFGGDGTMLRAAREYAGTGVPVIGVNLGTRGFLTELEPNELHLLPDIARGNYEAEHRITLDCRLERDGITVHKDFALNDCVIKGITKVTDLLIKCDNSKIERIVGDGVIVAAPTGSTAYNLSAGGPIMEPTTENMIVTPICAHALDAKPHILAKNRRIEIEVCGLKLNPAILTIDGNDLVEVLPGDKLFVTVGDKVSLFAHLPQKDFFMRVSEKLGYIK